MPVQLHEEDQSVVQFLSAFEMCSFIFGMMGAIDRQCGYGQLIMDRILQSQSLLLACVVCQATHDAWVKLQVLCHAIRLRI